MCGVRKVGRWMARPGSACRAGAGGGDGAATATTEEGVGAAASIDRRPVPARPGCSTGSIVGALVLAARPPASHLRRGTP